MAAGKVSRDNPEMAERIGLLHPPKKLIYGLMGFLLAYVIIRSVFAAAGKPFWYDELLTLTVSSQGNWSAILKALRLPLDGQPPLFYVIEHFALRFSRNQEIALRLPSILAFACTVACVFVYVKKRGGDLVAFLCAVFLLMTSVFQYYAVEARPFSMVVACIAFAMVCYQRLPSSLWTVLLAISLALAESLHYLAVLAMVPFGLAEIVLFFKTRRFRWPVWAALLVGALPLILSWGLLATIQAYYGAHFWASFKFSFIPHTYGEFFLTSSQFGAGIAAVAMIGVLGTALWHRPTGTTDTEGKGEVLAEVTLLIAFVALPFAGYLLTSVLHSGLTPRYVLSAVIGVCLAFGYILSQARFGALCLFAVFVFAAVGDHELHFWGSSQSQINDVRSHGKTAGRLVEDAGHAELPVIVPSGLSLVWLVHYAPPSYAARFIYLTQDTPTDGREWTDTVDKGMLLLQSYLPLRVSNFTEFTAVHRKFLIYVEERDLGGDWVSPHLLREGWSLQTVELDETRKIYLVTSNENTPGR
jgi:hypothetical protein